MNSNLLQYFEENGYIVVDDLIEKSLFERLLIASDKVVDMARAGEWVKSYFFLSLYISIGSSTSCRSNVSSLEERSFR